MTFQAQRRPMERRGGVEGGGRRALLRVRAPVAVGGSRGTEGLAIPNLAGGGLGVGQRQLSSVFSHDSMFFFLMRRIKIHPKNRKCLFKK